MNHHKPSLAIPFLRKPAGRPSCSYFCERSEFRGFGAGRAKEAVSRWLEAHVPGRNWVTVGFDSLLVRSLRGSKEGEMAAIIRDGRVSGKMP